MTKHLFRLVFVLAIILSAVPLHAQSTPASQPATQKAFFFTATSGKKTVYLFGSIHAASDDMYPLPPEIESAFKASSALLVEADVNNKTNQPAILGTILKKGLYARGDSLANHLDAETIKSLDAYCKAHKMSTTSLNTMKPWLAGMTLAMNSIEDLGLKTEQGIDTHFLKAAADSKKPIIELESADMQINLLCDLPDDLQIRILKSALDDDKDAKSDLEKLVKPWSAGDLAATSDFIFKGLFDEPKLRKIMIDDRNPVMAKGIEKSLATHDTLFVTVGAAHFVGNTGLLKLLEKSHFTLTQPPVTKPPHPVTKPPHPATKPARP